MSESESPIERWSDDHLLRAAQEGNDEAFRVFCVRSLPTLLSYLDLQCTRRGVPRDLAPDFVQSTVMKALDYLRSCRESADRPLPRVSVGWLMQIGFNLMMDWLRQNRRARKAREVLAAREKPRRLSTQQVDQLEEVHKYFTWLTLPEQEIVELVLLKGKTIAEVAAELEISIDAAYKRYERAISHLRDLIKEHGKTWPDRPISPD
jgi:RNA polymerase sigma factor (sigma-70 family)